MFPHEVATQVSHTRNSKAFYAGTWWNCHARYKKAITHPPWRQSRGKLMVSSVNSHTNATRIRWHLREIDLRFAPGLPPGWSKAFCVGTWWNCHARYKKTAFSTAAPAAKNGDACLIRDKYLRLMKITTRLDRINHCLRASGDTCVSENERFFLEFMTSDRQLNAYREDSK